MMAEVSLEFVLARVDRVLTELGGMRDDMAVLTAGALRVDGSQAAMLTRLRALHSQHSRMANRVRDLEAAKDA
jgi:hypothetical protein